jgi:hypothetical protein
MPKLLKIPIIITNKWVKKKRPKDAFKVYKESENYASNGVTETKDLLFALFLNSTVPFFSANKV